MKTLDFEFLVVLAVTCLAQQTMRFVAGLRWESVAPCTARLPGTAETPWGWTGAGGSGLLPVGAGPWGCGCTG